MGIDREPLEAAVRAYLAENGPTDWETLSRAIDAPVIAVHRALESLMGTREVRVVKQDPPCNPTYALSASGG